MKFAMLGWSFYSIMMAIFTGANAGAGRIVDAMASEAFVFYGFVMTILYCTHWNDKWKHSLLHALKKASKK